eukprot:11002037-Ditylum_brightwellii.AAC.1
MQIEKTREELLSFSEEERQNQDEPIITYAAYLAMPKEKRPLILLTDMAFKLDLLPEKFFLVMLCLQNAIIVTITG